MKNNKMKAINLLVKKGKDQGFLTQEDLLDIFPTKKRIFRTIR